MKFSVATVAALVLAVPALAAPTSGVLRKVNGPVKTDSYIVVLKQGVNRSAHVASLNKIAARADAASFSQVTHEYDSVLNGYAATLRGAALQHVLASSDVDYVEQDGIVSIKFIQEEHDENAVVERDELVSFDKRANGAGVNVYGIDTGVYTSHQDFGGRASFGAVYGGYAAQDGNGHGTHTAATAVGTRYGVATQARVIAVKVLSDQGSGSNSDVVSGINYAYNQFRSTGVPSIATMSLGGGANTAVDNAVQNALNGGLHFTVAAGNSNVDASGTSPARVGGANTIGAVDSSNRKASFSNYGSILDVWAPGVNILSAWIGSPSATNTISGTSMATPFVAGILAVAIGNYGQVSPASLSSSLKSHARGVVTGQPSGTNNLLATRW